MDGKNKIPQNILLFKNIDSAYAIIVGIIIKISIDANLNNRLN